MDASQLSKLEEHRLRKAGSQKEQITAAISDMATKVIRDSEHIYRNPDNGDMYQGVSSVSKIVPKDWLSAWGSKEAVKALGYSDYIEDEKKLMEKNLMAMEAIGGKCPNYEAAKAILDKIKTLDVFEYVALLKEAKGASSRKSKKAMIDGTKGHLFLEKFIETRLNGTNAPDIPTGTPLARPLMQFYDWEMANVDHWIASEALVVNPENRYGGQLDAIFVLKTGELCLGDFKFASNISEDYNLQCAGYAACFEPYGIKFDRRIIIRLPKTLEKEEWDAKTFKYKMVPNDIEVYTVPTPYEGDKEAFYAALIVKRWINYVTKDKNNDLS